MSIQRRSQSHRRRVSGTPAGTTLLNALVSYWTMDEESGTRYDSHGTNHLTDPNSATYEAGKIGNAVKTTGTGTKHLLIASNATLQLNTQDFTINAWVRFANVANAMIAGKDVTTSSREYNLGYNQSAGNFFRFGIGNATGKAIEWANASTFGAASTNTWYMVTGRYTHATKKIEVRVNNGVDDSTTISGITPAVGTADFDVGMFGGFVLAGRIDEVGIWSRRLTDDEVTELWNGGDGITYPFESPPVLPGVTIASPAAYQTFQRDGADQADIPISGTYTGSPAAIEASFNGGAYATIDAAPTGGSYSGTLSAQAAGQGTLTVRFTNQTTVLATASHVGIGDVFIIGGQSNAEAQLNHNQSYSHATLKATMYRQNKEGWAEMSDPTDSDGMGSFWPLLATLHMAAENVPMAVITVADNGMGLVNESHWDKEGDARQYDECVDVVQTSGANDALAMLWIQGERDARLGTSQAAYQAELSDLVDDLQADLGFASMKLVCAQIGHNTDGPTRAQLDAIRLAQQDRWINDADVEPGPLTYDLDLSGGDGLHFKTDEHAQIVANRFWRALLAAFFGGAEAARGPQFSSAVRSGTTVTVTFTGGEGNLQNQDDATGWRFTDDGAEISIVAAAANGTDKVDLTLDDTPSGVELISFGSGNDGAGTTLCDSGTYPLPPEPFVDQSVS